MLRFFTIGAVAQHFGLPTWQVRRAIARGFLDEPPRIGVYRVFVPDDLPRIESGLCAAGYLPARQQRHKTLKREDTHA